MGVLCPRAKPHRSDAIPYSDAWAVSLAKCSWGGIAGWCPGGHRGWCKSAQLWLPRQGIPWVPKHIWEWWQGPPPHAGPCHGRSTPKPSAKTALGPTFSCAGASLQPCSQANCCTVKLHGMKYQGRAWVQGLSSETPSPVEVDGI